jgi:sugar lactone lactonase YvrE
MSKREKKKWAMGVRVYWIRARGSVKSPRAIALLALSLLLLVGFPAWLQAEHTRDWRQSTYEEFLRGTSHGVAVRSDGRLELSPKFSLLANADASYLWSLRVDSKGAIYTAGGSPARVFRLDPAGKLATVFESGDLSAQALAFDGKGNLYVGTSPDGKVYRVSAGGEKTVFFDPKTKYIWDLAFGTDGTLYVATGDKGQIFAVAPDGKADIFYSSDEAHIRVLNFDKQGALIAGTEPNGRVLRVTHNSRSNAANEKNKSGDATAEEGFVLYETAKREITSLAVAADGTIYVAGIGEKQKAGASAPTTIIASPQGTTTITGGGTVGSGQQGQAAFMPFPPLLSSSIYRLSPDGSPEELWSSRDDVVYVLALTSEGRLLAGTGNSGALLRIDGRGLFAQLAKSASGQITGITRDIAGKIFFCTANPGKIFSLGPGYEAEGTFESHSFDAQLFSQWGRVDWWSSPASKPSKASSSGEPRLEFYLRSGNTEDPGKEWSRWYGPYSKPGSSVECPPARFVQWKAVIHDGRAGDGIDWVSVAYLPRNVAPVIDAVAVQDPGVRVQGSPQVQTGQTPNVALRLPQTANPGGLVITQSGPSPKFEQPPQGFQQKGYQSVLWSAHDDNDDDLRFAVFYRGENETQWKLLKDKLDQKFYSWDSTSLPDGPYYVKVTASDAPSNPPAMTLTAERESERFVIDNTPPVIEGLSAKVSQASAAKDAGLTSVAVKFQARDATSSIEHAQYSVDGSDWVLVLPANGISDAREESYSLAVEVSEGEHSIAVRAYDHFENVGNAKTNVVIQGAKP